jgi:hypothetical protein
MSEPLTAASFVLALLVYAGRLELRILPPIYNGGARVNLTIHAGTSGDWPQWQNVPYFVGALNAKSKTPVTTIKRVYLANDNANLYLRIDNVAGHFAGFKVAPIFAGRLYGTDLSGGNAEVTRLGLDGKPLGRPASFAVSRSSDENTFRRWRVQGAAWVEAEPVTGVLPPQWEVASGRLEAVIPFSALSSGGAPIGNWANLIAVLAFQNTNNQQFVDDGRVMIHYRLSGPGDAWTYGNIEV